MTALQCFAFDDNLVRVVDKDGSPWFVTKDICRAVGIKNWNDSVERLDDDEKGVGNSDTLGGEQGVSIVSESGLYTIILRSHSAMTPGSPAHRFRKWVTAEVLPAIRKTGHYGQPAMEGGDDTALPATFNEERIKLDKLHYALRCFGPAAARELWLQLGLDYVPAMALAVARGQASSAGGTRSELALARFAEERLARRPNVVTTAAAVYNAYREWAAENGAFVLSEGAFGKAMTRMGFEKVKSNRIYYRGVIVKQADVAEG